MRRSVVGGLLLAACQSAPAPRGPVVAVQAPSHGPEPLETIALSGAATSRTVLARGELYLLRARGLVAAGELQVDAEWALPRGGTATDAVGGLDVGIDVGLKRILPATGRKPAPPTDQRPRWFGPYRGDHVYHLLVTGTGAPLSLRLVAPRPIAGALEVALYPLTPAPPAVGPPLETVMVPARPKVSVQSRSRPPMGSVHLLQVAGEVQVGGPGAMGDAEFHDYKADGRGHNEGEAGVDFGVGVDEAQVGTPDGPGTGSGHPQRRLKWGPFRLDHTYYMLHAGTGEAIGLNYHDSGGRSGIYRDNDGALPVSIFPVP